MTMKAQRAGGTVNPITVRSAGVRFYQPSSSRDRAPINLQRKVVLWLIFWRA